MKWRIPTSGFNVFRLYENRDSWDQTGVIPAEIWEWTVADDKPKLFRIWILHTPRLSLRVERSVIMLHMNDVTRTLINRARDRARLKRGGERRRIDLSKIMLAIDTADQSLRVARGQCTVLDLRLPATRLGAC